MGRINETDDGSLAFLKLERDEGRRVFHCEKKTLSDLVNTEFWICDFIEDVPTKFSKMNNTGGQTLFLGKWNPDDTESKGFKVFTGNPEILSVLRKIKEMDAFPRKVTLHRQGNSFYFE